jgi:hypothetical protein
MDFDKPAALLKDRRVVIAAGVAIALILGLTIALASVKRTRGPVEPPPASQGGLVVEMGRDDDVKLDPTRSLRCFVGGQFVGMSTLAECAKRNGVATGALDVGIDVTGELAATGEAGTVLTPLPPPAEEATPAPAAAATEQVPAAAPRGPVAVCWRYVDRSWARMSEMSLNACVQALFAGRCERAGGATYGRWGDQTLRLVPGRVEQSPDDRSFRTLVEQGTNCSLPSL